jgi:cytochrome bd-type quinol oxidase subunit 1
VTPADSTLVDLERAEFATTSIHRFLFVPLALERLAALFLESTLLGLSIFGWDRLSPRRSR